VATFSETRVDIGITVTRTRTGQDRVILSARTLDLTSGTQIRRVRRDVTDLMTQARMDGIKLLIDDAVVYLKQQLQLPADVAVGPDEA
jgi:hypothetical protein